MENNQQIGGLEAEKYFSFDMTSGELHCNVICPLCGNIYMVKVEMDKILYTPCECHVQYKMTEDKIEMNLTLDQAERYFLKP